MMNFAITSFYENLYSMDIETTVNVEKEDVNCKWKAFFFVMICDLSFKRIKHSFPSWKKNEQTKCFIQSLHMLVMYTKKTIKKIN